VTQQNLVFFDPRVSAQQNLAFFALAPETDAAGAGLGGIVLE